MFRNFHNSRGSPSCAGNQNPRWRIVCIALVLALGLSGVPQPAPAQAQDSWSYRVTVTNPRSVICTNETVIFHVRILATGSLQPGEAPDTLVEPMNPGIKIATSNSNPAIGDFTDINPLLSGPIPGPGAALAERNTADLTYKANSQNQAGRATLIFGAKVGDTVATPFTMQVMVLPCRLQVITVSRWAQSYPNGSIKFLAITYDSEMTVVDESGSYQGTGKVVWISTSVVPKCTAKNTLQNSTVTMRGTLTRTNKIAVMLTFEPAIFTDMIACPFGTGGASDRVAAAPLEYLFPSIGGYRRFQQHLDGGPGGADGTADVWVYPLALPK